MFLNKYNLIFFLLFYACKPVQISTELNHHEAKILFQQAKENAADYTLKYNNDSVYAICQYIGKEYIIGKPVSFFVYDIKDKRMCWVSIKEYNKAEWKDSSTIRLTRYSGIPKGSSLQNYSSREGVRVYLLNVKSKELSEQYDSNR